MGKKITAVILTLVMCLSLCYGTASAADSDTIDLTVTVTYCQTMARSMLDEINEFRTDEDEAWYWSSDDTTKTYVTLDELTYDYALEAVAMQRAAEIAVSYSHTRPNGENCWTAYNGVYVYTAAAENIAYGYTSASSVLTAWKEADEDYSGQGHRRNLLSSSVTSIGIACVYYNGYYYWVQDFGSSYSSADTTSTEANDSATDVTVEVLESYLSSGSLSLSENAVTLECGSTAALPDVTLTASVTNHKPSGTVSGIVDEDDVSWTSADSSIASVGSIVANAIGTTTFTATVADYTATLSVTVTGTSIEDFTVVLEPTTYEYTGNALTPSVTVTDNDGNKLTQDTDYTVSYSDNVDVGTATVTITGTGNYTGTITKTFAIVECSHNYSSVTTEATCTEDGYIVYTCSKCNDTYTETIAATGHTEGEAVTENEVAATCTENGSYDSVVYCTVCGEELSRETVTVDALGHNYEVTASEEATCTEDGYVTYTCTVCGDTYTEMTEALGHTEGEAVVENEVAATCTEDGSYDSVVYCTVCGEEISRETVTVEATGHSYEVTDSEDATCTEDGYIVYTCAVCGDTYTEVVEATGHTAGEAVVENEVAATCTEDGSYDSVIYCTVCDEELSRETVTVAATGHSYEVVGTVEATCTEDGSVTYTCTVCGDTYIETIDALGHSAGEAVTENEIAATCTEDGSYDSVVYCTVCGEELSRETVTVDAIGHNYEVTETVEATCITNGYVVYTCTNCGSTYTITTDMTGLHVSGEAVIENEIAATCEEAGSYDSVVYCTVCGEEISRETVTTAATGHSYEVTDSEDATCTEDGSVTYTCTVCGDTYTETTAALGHTEGEAVTENEVEATCEEAGSYDSVIYCTVCGTEISRETVTVDALGHDWTLDSVVWAEDYSSAHVTLACSNDESHTATVEAEVVSSTDEAGNIVYTLTVDYDGVTFSETKAVEVETTTEADTEEETTTEADTEEETTTEVETEEETTTEADTEEETTTEADTEEETTTEADTEEETTTEADTEEETTTEADTEEETTTAAETEEETTTEADTEEESTTEADTEEETTTAADTTESSASASNEGTTESDETTAASSDSDSVETGDNSSVMLWLSVLAIGVVGVLGVSEIRRRQRGNR